MLYKYDIKGQNPPIYCSRRMIIRKIKEMGIIALKDENTTKFKRFIITHKME